MERKLIKRIDLVNKLFSEYIIDTTDKDTLRIINKVKNQYLRMSDYEFIELYPISLRAVRKNLYYII